MLGPLLVETDGVELEVGGLRGRTALATLLLRRNRVVPVDQLVDALWGEAPPSTCRQQVQTCVSLLRRNLAGAGAIDAIQTRRPGYRLCVEADQVDQDRFDALAAAGRALLAEQPANAERLLREALGCWRGTPLADIDSALIRTMAFGLAEAEAAVAEDWLEALLALGRYDEVCREATTLVARHPLRERLLRQQITALYRAGRTADALAAYRRTRDLFVDELGLEPSPQLQEVQRAILGHETVKVAVAVPAGSVPPSPAPQSQPVPRQLPRATGGFVGRDALVDRLRTHLLGPDTAPVAALTGPGGVGKTALAVHTAQLISGHFPDGQLYVTFGGGGRRRRWTDADVLERLLRSLGIPGTAVPDEVDDRVALYRSLIADRRLLLVLDDAVDERDVRDLLPVNAGCAALITSQRRCTGLSGVLHVDVDVLGPDDGAELLANLTGRRLDLTEPDATRNLVGLCGGLPLALHIAGAKLAAHPHWTVDGYAARLRPEHRRLDELTHGTLGVRPGISRSYDGLSTPARQLFRRLGLVELADFAAWIAAPLLDIDLGRAVALLDELVEARLLDVSGDEQHGLHYRMPELSRVFSRERVAADDAAADSDAALVRVLSCLLHLAVDNAALANA
jgi:DNA-binding SARP family transcriptional activator